MVALPTIDEENAKRPSRERESLVGERTRIVNRMKAALARLGIRGFKPELRRAPQKLDGLRTPENLPIPPNALDEIRRDLARLAIVREQIDGIEQARLTRIEQAPETGPNAMVRLLAGVVGVETADMPVPEVLSRNLRDRRAIARYAGLAGSPDESGSKQREKGWAKSGNARVRRGLIQLAWRFLLFQKDSALAQWCRAWTGRANGACRTTMAVALARKLLMPIALIPDALTIGSDVIPLGQLLWFALPLGLAWETIIVAAIARQDVSADDLRREAGRTRDAKAARRMLAVALVMEGPSREAAAERCGMDRRTLRDWVHRYNAGGIAGLGDRHGGGVQPRPSPEQEAEVADWIRTGPDVEMDGVVRWRCVDIQARIARRFGVAVHERSVGKLLHRLRFARMSTRPRHPKADPAVQAFFGPAQIAKTVSLGSQPL